MQERYVIFECINGVGAFRVEGFHTATQAENAANNKPNHFVIDMQMGHGLKAINDKHINA